MDMRVEVGSSSKQEVLSLTLLQGAAIDHAWPRIETLLKDDGLLSDAWTPQQVLEALIEMRMQAWAAGGTNLLLLTQFYRTGTTAIFQIFWAHGEELQKWLPLMSDAFDRFAAFHGAEKIEIQGRKGFERLLKPFGFEVDYVTYSRRVKTMVEN